MVGLVCVGETGGLGPAGWAVRATAFGVPGACASSRGVWGGGSGAVRIC